MNRNYNGTTVETNGVRTIAGGGTGAADAATARTNLGLGTAATRNTEAFATLGEDGKVPAALLPSYVDDVLEFSSLSAFPGTGEGGKIYTAKDTNKIYRWSGSTYIEISPSPGSTDSVTEGTTNLYFTAARAVSALTETLASYATQAWVTAQNYITLASLTWSNISGKPTSFTPTTHASTHASGGSDPITVSSSQVTGLGTSASKDVAASGNASPTQVVLGSDSRIGANGMFRREDFLNGSSGLVLFASNVAGGSITTAINPTISESRAGIQRFQTGTTSAVDQRGGVTTQNLVNFFPGDGNRYYFGVGLRTVAPYFDATTQGYYQFGFVNVASSFGACFLGFSSQNGGNWTCYSANAGATTSFDTGISVSDNNWKDFAFVYYENGDRVDFFVNNTRVVTFWKASGTNNATNIYSANINTSANLVGLKGMVHRTTASATSYGLDVDYMDFGVRYAQAILDRNKSAIALL